MIKLLDILNEVGEANVKPFNWAKTSGADVKQFKERMGSEAWRDIGYDTVNTYEFTTDKGTVYVVDIMIESVYNEESYSKFDSGTVEASIDFSTKNKAGKANMDVTNMHEQYAVMSTITDIFTTWINEWDEELYISKIKIDPIKESDEDGDNVDSRRGKLYHAFMKKQLSKLNKQYGVRVFSNYFLIQPKFDNSN
jgi:hypothetical protein